MLDDRELLALNASDELLALPVAVPVLAAALAAEPAPAAVRQQALPLPLLGTTVTAMSSGSAATKPCNVAEQVIVASAKRCRKNLTAPLQRSHDDNTTALHSSSCDMLQDSSPDIYAVECNRPRSTAGRSLDTPLKLWRRLSGAASHPP